MMARRLELMQEVAKGSRPCRLYPGHAGYMRPEFYVEDCLGSDHLPMHSSFTFGDHLFKRSNLLYAKSLKWIALSKQ